VKVISKWAAALALTLVAGVLVVGCGGDDSSSEKSSSSSAAKTASPDT